MKRQQLRNAIAITIGTVPTASYVRRIGIQMRIAMHATAIGQIPRAVLARDGDIIRAPALVRAIPMCRRGFQEAIRVGAVSTAYWQLQIFVHRPAPHL